LKEEPGAHCDRLTYIIGELSWLVADIEENVLDPERICTHADLIQEALSAWFHTLPAQFTSDLGFPPRGLVICLAMNQYRCAQITVYQILSRWRRSETLVELLQRKEQVSRLVSDMMGSLPFLPHFSVLPLLWPLFTLASIKGEGSDWAREYLHFIWEKTRIGQSLVLLQRLEESPPA
jgi:hypothetical protein